MNALKEELTAWFAARGQESVGLLAADALDGVPFAERAAASLKLWIGGPGADSARCAALRDNPAFLHRLLTVCGASQACANAIANAPQLAMILADVDELSGALDFEELSLSGRSLMAQAVSLSHELDRLRFLKQRTMIKTVWNDLSGAWAPEQVWQSLSTLADALLALSAGRIWREISNEPNPVAVIALGKHGAGEVNYSSDIDVMFVLDDNAAHNPAAARFCERFIRGVGGKMSRGALYRLDCRLRPMGAIGPIVQTESATLAYYNSAAEPWEILAMIRARPCAGNIQVAERFLNLLRKTVYRGARSEAFLDELVASKQRYEKHTQKKGEQGANVKLGTGGIRDIEFLVQLLQLVAGDKHPELQSASTLRAIQILSGGRLRLLASREAKTLAEAYRFYRQLEHRIQMAHDRQTHLIPADEFERQQIAMMMGLHSGGELLSRYRSIRYEVRSILESRIPQLSSRAPAEDEALNAFENLSSGERTRIARLIDLSSDRVNFSHELKANPKARKRVELIALRAPVVIPWIAFHSELWDIAFSDQPEHEQQDETSPAEDLQNALADSGRQWEQRLAQFLRREKTAACLKHAFHNDCLRTSRRLTEIADSAILSALDLCGGSRVDVVGVGRLGGSDLLLPSDWDIMFLHDDAVPVRMAEHACEQFMRASRAIALASQNFPIDVRLRPEGKSGMLACSHSAFQTYVETRLETWERIALTHARSLRGDFGTQNALQIAAPWTNQNELEAAQMRSRVQTERIQPEHLHRDIKLGPGGLLDIEWLAAILKLRLGPTQNCPSGTVESLRFLAEKGSLNPYESERLQSAFLFLSNLRNVLYLLESDSDAILPENPDKLDEIARCFQLDSGNALLREVRDTQSAVEGIAKLILNW